MDLQDSSYCEKLWERKKYMTYFRAPSDRRADYLIRLDFLLRCTQDFRRAQDEKFMKDNGFAQYLGDESIRVEN